MNDAPVYTAEEFEEEAQRIETLVWEALAVEPGMRVLFCGYGKDGSEVARAVEAGAQVTVVEHRDEMLRRYADLGATALRGSTSVIPLPAQSIDLAVAFHYLHEADPFFHAQIVSELARVASRIAVVEPAPPADPLGKRIASLYAQAKRELGQFEYYQPLEYWKKLVQAVRAEVAQHVFAFEKVPPREYLRDTIALLLDTMEVEDAPQRYLDELREIARRDDAMLLPPPRYVIMGAPVGELPRPRFTPRVQRTAAATRESRAPIPAVRTTASESDRSLPESTPERVVSAEAGYAFPPIVPPPDTSAATGGTSTMPSAPTTFPSRQSQQSPPIPQPQPFTQPPQLPQMPPPAPVPPPIGPQNPDTETSSFGIPFALPDTPNDSEDEPFGPLPKMPPPGWRWEPPGQ
jgi:ubiquinone/menaquinone biosynthesis C-methylase UbiE